jgi:arylformamidase
MLYRGMDRAALDAAYNNRAAVAAFPAISAERVARSREVRARRRLRADLRYGESARERLDLFDAERPDAPILAFIHGGYWQSNDKEASSFLVEGPLARGFSVALIEYTLAPEADIDRMVLEIFRATSFLGRLGKVVLAGHSAGGHLTAMMLGKLPLAGALAISGLYDLEPIRLNYLNEKLRLSEDAAQRNSPLRHLPAASPPLVITVGADELPELVRQSAEYAAALRERGLPVSYLPLEGHDHFSILEELANPDGRLCVSLSGLMK